MQLRFSAKIMRHEQREAERRETHPNGSPHRRDRLAQSRKPSAARRAPCPDALAFRRSTAALRRGLTRLGSGPRFLEPPDANGRTLSGASAAGTLQSEHAPDGTMPRTACGEVTSPAGRNRTRSVSRPSPVDVPHMSGIFCAVRERNRNVKRFVRGAKLCR